MGLLGFRVLVLFNSESLHITISHRLEESPLQSKILRVSIGLLGLGFQASGLNQNQAVRFRIYGKGVLGF